MNNIILLLLIYQTVSAQFFASYIPEESPKTINIAKGEAFVFVNPGISTLNISIPNAFSSQRYIGFSYSQNINRNYIYYLFSNDATITIHFVTNISFYTINCTKLQSISTGCIFLSEKFNINCSDDFQPYNPSFILLSNLNNKNIVKFQSFEKRIQDFSSMLPYSLKIKISETLFSNSKIYIDIGSGKKLLSTYNLFSELLPFNAKFYISHQTCDLFHFKNISITGPSNYSITFTPNSIPIECYSYSVSIFISSNFSNDAKVIYQINKGPFSDSILSAGSKINFSKDYPFKLKFYVRNSVCNEFSIMKIVSIDNRFDIQKVELFDSDIPKICLKENQRTNEVQEG